MVFHFLLVIGLSRASRLDLLGPTSEINLNKGEVDNVTITASLWRAREASIAAIEGSINLLNATNQELRARIAVLEGSTRQTQMSRCYDKQKQDIATKGALDWEHFEVGGVHYLLVANFYDDTTRQINSVLYRFDETSSSLVAVQSDIATKGATDWQHFEVGGVHYLLVANYYDDTTYQIDSVLYRFDETSSSLVAVQSDIATKGALDWEHFEVGGVHYLLVANFQDDTTYQMNSVLYPFDCANVRYL